MGRAAQGLNGDALQGVQLAGLPGSGSGFAVFLIHNGWSQAGERRRLGSPATRPSLKHGCYHRRSVNVL
ncbi:MAG TPA: hypothetical protein VHD85_13115 [Terracidiphilus sp.]|jgi:hypothetical protein|nr:hypothetical protein [Terracidiphilus sp.]